MGPMLLSIVQGCLLMEVPLYTSFSHLIPFNYFNQQDYENRQIIDFLMGCFSRV